MNPYIDILKTYFAEHSPVYSTSEISCVVDLLCYCYTIHHPIDSPLIRSRVKNLNTAIGHLSLQENDRISDLMCEISSAYQDAAFREGLRIGTLLTLELTAENG